MTPIYLRHRGSPGPAGLPADSAPQRPQAPIGLGNPPTTAVAAHRALQAAMAAGDIPAVRHLFDLRSRLVSAYAAALDASYGEALSKVIVSARKL